MKSTRNIFTLALIAVLAISFQSCSKFMGNMMGESFLYPPEQPFPKTPKDYGIEYKDVTFKTDDNLTLSGWLLNESAEKIIIMTHFGYRANRYGYQVKHQPGPIKPYKKEIEFVKVAKRLTDAGYGVLMYDLRNHGVSEKTKTGCGTGGIDEANDVTAAVKYISSNETTKGKDIGLLSYCMGANATFFAQAKNNELFSSYVKALVAMQPLTNGEFLCAYGYDRDSKVYEIAESKFKEQTGYSLDAPVLEQVDKVVTPTLLCQGLNDPWTNLDFINAVYEKLPVEKEMYWMEEPTHRFDGYNWFYEHPEKMLEWFTIYLPLE